MIITNIFFEKTKLFVYYVDISAIEYNTLFQIMSPKKVIPKLQKKLK